MLSKLKALLEIDEQGSARLTELKPEPQVAVCAILLEVARIDGDFDPAERETIVTSLREAYDLSLDEVEDLIALAEEERARHPDLWAFTNVIGRAYTPEEKLTVLVMVWQVIFADEVLDVHEDMLVHKLQHMLAVNHSVVMKAKRKAREKTAS
jgi:uncharacterized tellurite resistance protein B-like protein